MSTLQWPHSWIEENGSYMYYWNIDNNKVKPRPNWLFFLVIRKSTLPVVLCLNLQSIQYFVYTICDTITNELCLFLHELTKYTSANIVFYLVESLTFFRATPFRIADMRSLLRSAAGGADLGGDTLRSWICPRCSEANTSSIVPVGKQNTEDGREGNSKDSSLVDLFIQ